jgi:hypothetical protein
MKGDILSEKLLANKKTILDCINNQVRVIDRAYENQELPLRIKREEAILVQLRKTYLIAGMTK